MIVQRGIPYKTVFKKCAVGKNKNTEALAFGSAVWWLICPVTCLCFILSFILAVSSFRLAGNVLQLAEGGAFGVPIFQATINVYSEPKSFCHLERPAFGKVLLWAAYYSYAFRKFIFVSNC